MARPIRPTRVEVDLAAVEHNARALRDVSGAPLLAVVKADAYGHGAVAVGRHLAESGAVHGLAVSLVEEAVQLREAGVGLPILVMGPSMGGGEREILTHSLWPMVSSLRTLRALVAAAADSGSVAEVHLKLDTGMGRLGLTPAELTEARELIARSSGVRLSGIATHLACADHDDPGDPDCMTARQLAAFDVATVGLGHEILRHVANSAGAMRFPGARQGAVRPGLALYGAGVASGDARFRPTTRFVSAITQLRAANSGTTVGYDARWTARRPSSLAVVPVGYADGLPRSLTGKAEALVRGRRVPVVGVISMDITVLDVTDLASADVGDEVVFLGVQGAEQIAISEFAQRAGTSEYEVTCGISKRVPREYR